MMDYLHNPLIKRNKLIRPTEPNKGLTWIYIKWKIISQIFARYSMKINHNIQYYWKSKGNLRES